MLHNVRHCSAISFCQLTHILLLVFNNGTDTALCYFALSAALRERGRERER